MILRSYNNIFRAGLIYGPVIIYCHGGTILTGGSMNFSHLVIWGTMKFLLKKTKRVDRGPPLILRPLGPPGCR